MRDTSWIFQAMWLVRSQLWLMREFSGFTLHIINAYPRFWNSKFSITFLSFLKKTYETFFRSFVNFLLDYKKRKSCLKKTSQQDIIFIHADAIIAWRRSVYIVTVLHCCWNTGKSRVYIGLRRCRVSIVLKTARLIYRTEHCVIFLLPLFFPSFKNILWRFCKKNPCHII